MLFTKKNAKMQQNNDLQQNSVCSEPNIYPTPATFYTSAVCTARNTQKGWSQTHLCFSSHSLRGVELGYCQWQHKGAEMANAFTPCATLCLELLMNPWKKQACEPLFSLFEKVFKKCHQKEGQDTYPEKFPQAWVILFWVLVWFSLRKYIKFNYSY